MTARFGALGPELHRAGWDVVPIQPKTKRPIIEGWQRGFTTEQVAELAANGYAAGSIGLLARKFPGADIDVLDGECADAIERCVVDVLGPAPVRYGTAPKRLLMYTTAEPFTKVKVFLRGPNGDRGPDGKKYAIEFLGDGQQYVIYGQHPDGHDYRWPASDGPGGSEVWDLTSITRADVDRVIAALPQYLPDGWSRVDTSGHVPDMSCDVLSQIKMPLDGWDAERVDMEILPFLTGYDEYEDWMHVGMALHHQGEGDPKWLDLWDNWSSQSGKWVEGVCADKWAGFSEQRFQGKGAVTLASLLYFAKKVRGEMITDQRFAQNSEFQFISVGELIERPVNVQYLVDELLEESSVGSLFGATGTFKSFIAIDIAASIATNTPWRGKSVSSGPVFYIAGEGQAGLGRRAKAWEIERGISLASAPLYFSNAPTALMDNKSIQTLISRVSELAEKFGQPKLVVIDTLHRNFGAGDENSAMDMAVIFQNLDILRLNLGCSILIIHHSGHNTNERARGSSSFRAGLDFEFKVTSKAINQICIECTKTKDAEHPAIFEMASKQVLLPWQDRKGNFLTSLVLNEVQVSPDTRKPLKGAIRVVYEALKKRVEMQTHASPDEPAFQRCGCNNSTWKEAAFFEGLSNSTDLKSREKAFSRAKKVLLENGLVYEEGGIYSIV